MVDHRHDHVVVTEEHTGTSIGAWLAIAAIVIGLIVVLLIAFGGIGDNDTGDTGDGNDVRIQNPADRDPGGGEGSTNVEGPDVETGNGSQNTGR